MGGGEAAPNPEEEGRRGSEHGQAWGPEHSQAPATRGGGSFRFRGNNRPVFEQRNPQRGWGHRGCQQWNGNGFNAMWEGEGCNADYGGYDNNYEFFPAHRQWYNQRMPGWAMGQEFPYWESYRVPSLQFRDREEEESWLQWRRERTQRQEEEAGPSTRREKEAYPTNTRMQKEDTSTQRPVVATAAREAPMGNGITRGCLDGQWDKSFHIGRVIGCRVSSLETGRKRRAGCSGGEKEHKDKRRRQAHQQGGKKKPIQQIQGCRKRIQAHRDQSWQPLQGRHLWVDGG
ncbi:uncharacterized protein LOC121402966 isoform X4 [Xenopus laevis]|uniref:Uncharacterized protein LOC121402966 isoform X4 n=1 Tax=Xenopus laevis TaxID=8355 RepID=A0A8J1MWS7_XENLA|nr:uncharacterized protein LOC121402966 isoform X4 [Xenopus laevis]